MENTAQISHAFLVKLVIRLMTHGAAGFLHRTETVGNVAWLACDVPGTRSAFRTGWDCSRTLLTPSATVPFSAGAA